MRELAKIENWGGSRSGENERLAHSDGRGGGGSHAAASPSFLVLL